MKQHQRSLSILAALLTALLCLVAPRPAAAADAPATAAVRQVNDSVAALLRKKVAAGSAEEKKVASDLSALLGRFLDVDGMGQRALVDHWAELSAAQKQEFSALLRRLVESSYLRALRSNPNYEVGYLGSSEKNGDQVVNTELRTKQKDRVDVTAIDYVLHQDGGGLRAVNVITDGVGMVENYRAQFNKVIKEHGFTGLLEKMKKKAAAGDAK